MSLDYYFLEEDQSRPDIEISQPIRHGYLLKNAFSLEEVVHYTNSLHKLPWRIQEIVVAGKSYLPKRETLGLSDPAHENLLENRSFYGQTYSEEFNEIRSKVQDILSNHISELEKPEMNFCWGNRYRTGEDKVGKHKDNEKWHSLIDPIISVSFGEHRFFDVYDDTKRIFRTELGHGDIFLMMPGFQEAYYHSIPIQKRIYGSRINLTFRTLIPPSSVEE